VWHTSLAPARRKYKNAHFVNRLHDHLSVLFVFVFQVIDDSLYDLSRTDLQRKKGGSLEKNRTLMHYIIDDVS